jgi:hypothetical protein
MDVSEMLLWAIVLTGVVLGWLKLAHGDESESCCAVILLVLAIAGLAVTGFVWTVGSLIGWW